MSHAAVRQTPTNLVDQVTLFVIDDDELDVMALKRALRKQQLTPPLAEAFDGQQALDMLADDEVESPFVILLDLNMPRMSGLEFLERLRQHPQYSNTCVFVMTTSDAEADVEQAQKFGVGGYFQKSVIGDDFSPVLAAVGRAMDNGGIC